MRYVDVFLIIMGSISLVELGFSIYLLAKYIQRFDTNENTRKNFFGPLIFIYLIVFFTAEPVILYYYMGWPPDGFSILIGGIFLGIFGVVLILSIINCWVLFKSVNRQGYESYVRGSVGIFFFTIFGNVILMVFGAIFNLITGFHTTIATILFIGQILGIIWVFVTLIMVGIKRTDQ